MKGKRMKWHNRGKEFETKMNIMKGRSLFIYGAGETGKMIYNFLPVIKSSYRGCIDVCVGKTLDNSLPYICPIDFQKFSQGLIVICVGDSSERNRIIAQFREKDITCVSYVDWMNHDAYIYTLANLGLVVAPLISLQFSDKCNLSCNGCLACTPYLREQQFFGVDTFRKNIDALFENIDYVQVLDVCGGEPLLVDDDYIVEIFKYIALRYRDKIDVLRTVINGTVIPSEKVCKIWRDARVTVLVDDYRDSLGTEGVHIGEIEAMFSIIGVQYQINKVEHWIDLGITSNEVISEEMALIKHDTCQNYFRAIRDGKIHMCDYAFYADKAEIIVAEEDEYMDLKKTNRWEMLEFLMGFSQRGFCNMCRVCNGGTKINKLFMAVAKQNGEVNELPRREF